MKIRQGSGGKAPHCHEPHRRPATMGLALSIRPRAPALGKKKEKKRRRSGRPFETTNSACRRSRPTREVRVIEVMTLLVENGRRRGAHGCRTTSTWIDRGQTSVLRGAQAWSAALFSEGGCARPGEIRMASSRQCGTRPGPGRQGGLMIGHVPDPRKQVPFKPTGGAEDPSPRQGFGRKTGRQRSFPVKARFSERAASARESESSLGPCNENS